MRTHIAQALLNMFIHLSRSGLFLLLKVIPMIRSILSARTPPEKQIIMDYYSETSGHGLILYMHRNYPPKSSAQSPQPCTRAHNCARHGINLSRHNGEHFLTVNKTGPPRVSAFIIHQQMLVSRYCKVSVEMAVSLWFLESFASLCCDCT